MKNQKDTKPKEEKKKRTSMQKIVELLQKEDQFLDDHGPIIFGHRLKRPVMTDLQETED